MPVEMTGMAFPTLDIAFDAAFAPDEVAIFLIAFPAPDLLTLETAELIDFTLLRAVFALFAAFPNAFAES